MRERESEAVVCVCVRTNVRTCLAPLASWPVCCVSLLPTFTLMPARHFPMSTRLCWTVLAQHLATRGSAAPAIVHLPCIELYGAFSSTGAWPLLLCARASSVFEHARCIFVTLQIRHRAPNGHWPRLQRQAPRERHMSRIRMAGDSWAPSVGYLSYLRRPPRLSALRSVSLFHVQM